MSSPNTAIKRPHNLRLQPTRLIGRDHDLEVVCQRLLQSDVRLLTLSGPGGTGKTRLALAVGERVLDLFEHGVFFVDLAPLSDPKLVIPTVAQTLGIAEVAGLPLLEHLTDVLVTQRILLLLDNFEHVASAAPDVAHLLANCPGVRVLATSREALHLSWERLHPIAPLRLPNLHDLPASDELSQVPAVALFVERARAVQPGFTLDKSNARAVAELCVRLDGLPLAIVLAAARSHVLPPGALLNRLAQHLDLLSSDARDEPARHRTLQAAIAWSYNLLTPEEQTLLRRLSVFARRLDDRRRRGGLRGYADRACGSDEFAVASGRAFTRGRRRTGQPGALSAARNGAAVCSGRAGAARRGGGGARSAQGLVPGASGALALDGS